MSGVESTYAWWRLAASVTLSTVGGIGMWCLVVALPSIQQDLGITRADISFAYTMNTLGFFAGGVTWGAYQTLEAALDDPRLFKANPVFQDIRHPSGLTYPAPGAMGTIPQDQRGPVLPAPKLGQHTDEVLAGAGLTAEAIAELRAKGVV